MVHNIPGTPYDGEMLLLREYARSQLSGPPIYLSLDQAKQLLPQFQETASHRGWHLIAVAIMSNHCHIVVGVPGDPEPGVVLGDFKSYGSRLLNERWGKRESGTWWTDRGSKRKLPNENAVIGAVRYVGNQTNPLVVWIANGFSDEELARS